jgi:hypothetical protein
MAVQYAIKVRGRLSPTLVAEFEDLQLAASVEAAETVIHGPVTDQAALYGLLRRVEALGLELMEVRRFPADSRDDPNAGLSPESEGQSSSS